MVVFILSNCLNRLRCVRIIFHLKTSGVFAGWNLALSFILCLFSTVVVRVTSTAWLSPTHRHTTDCVPLFCHKQYVIKYWNYVWGYYDNSFNHNIVPVQGEPVHHSHVSRHSDSAQTTSAGEETQCPAQHCSGALVLRHVRGSCTQQAADRSYGWGHGGGGNEAR